MTETGVNKSGNLPNTPKSGGEESKQMSSLSPSLIGVLMTLKEAADSAVQTAQEIGEKHQITEKTKAATDAAFQKAKDLDEKFQLTKLAKEATETAVKKAIEFEEEHKVVDAVKRQVEAVSDSANSALERAADYDDEHQVVEKSLAAVTKSVEFVSIAVQSVISDTNGIENRADNSSANWPQEKQ